MAPVLLETIRSWGPAFEVRSISSLDPGDSAFVIVPGPGIGKGWAINQTERVVSQLTPWLLGGGSLIVMFDNTTGKPDSFSGLHRHSALARRCSTVIATTYVVAFKPKFTA
jgi:hypothetical protein